MPVGVRREKERKRRERESKTERQTGRQTRNPEVPDV